MLYVMKPTINRIIAEPFEKLNTDVNCFFLKNPKVQLANSKKHFFNLFNEKSGKILTTHHNKQIIENIETFNTFFANIGVELAKAFDTKQKYEIEINTNTMFCFPITSS